MEQPPKKIFKAGFIGLASGIILQMIREQENNQEELKDNESLEEIQFYVMITIEDWSNVPQESLTPSQKIDPKNVISLKRVTIEKSEQEFFQYHTSYPYYFQYTPIPNKPNAIQISGGIYTEINDQQESEYISSKDIYNLQLNQTEKDGENQFSLKFEQQQKVVFVVDSEELETAQLSKERTGHGCLSLGNKIYYIQGNSFSDYFKSSEYINLEEQKFYNLPENTVAKSRACSIAYTDENNQEFIYSIGGFSEYESDKIESKEISKLDLKKNEWQQLKVSSLTRPGTGAYGFQHPTDKKVYLLGGVSNKNEPSSTIYRLDEKDGKIKFQKIGDLYSARKSPQVKIHQDSNNQVVTIYVFGGNNKSNTLEYFQINAEGKLENHYEQDYEQLLSKFQYPLSQPNFADNLSFVI